MVYISTNSSLSGCVGNVAHPTVSFHSGSKNAGPLKLLREQKWLSRNHESFPPVSALERVALMWNVFFGSHKHSRLYVQSHYCTSPSGFLRLWLAGTLPSIVADLCLCHHKPLLSINALGEWTVGHAPNVSGNWEQQSLISNWHLRYQCA